MGKKGLKTTGYILVLFFIPLCLFADTGVTILTSTGQALASVRISLDKMKPHSSTITTVDPNFHKDGMTTFTGITLKTLLSLSDIPVDSGVTIIASDQYIAYIPARILFEDNALLAWHLNGNKISSMKGGPLKIVYPDKADVHGSCYVWYVDTIIAGEFKKPSFQMICEGETRKIRVEDIASGVEQLDAAYFSLPPGCRSGLGINPSERAITAISLNRLVDLVFGRQVDQATFIPYAGSSIRIGKAALSFPIYIILGMDNKPIHPSFGGPFSVVFPVEQHHSLASIVPESGALFFLDKILLE